jgi:hypothetical protein
MDAVQWLPSDKHEWIVARNEWENAVLASSLSPATKVLALVLSRYINRNTKNRLFNWAWPAHGTLAKKAGLSRRTVGSGLDELEQTKLIVVDRGGGAKGQGGRTHRYTLRMDHLNDLGGRPVEDADAQNLRNLITSEDANILRNSVDVSDEASCANDGIELGNLRPKGAKGFPMTLLNNSLDDSLTSHTSNAGNSVRPRKDASKEKGKPLVLVQPFVEPKENRNSSVDQTNLARFVGCGDVRLGWETLQRLPEGAVDKMARHLRSDKSAGEMIANEVRSLLNRAAVGLDPAFVTLPDNTESDI